MGFFDHLTELRVRLVRCLIAAFIGFMLCYSVAEDLFGLLMEPLVRVFPPDTHLIFTTLPEAFFTYMTVAAVAGIFVASPYIFYQVWCFVAPGLYEEERKTLFPIAFFSAFFFVAGAMFGYHVVFPHAFEFFMSYTTELIRPMPALKEYLNFSLKMLFAFGLIFEMPLFVYFLARLGLVTPGFMRKNRKYAILIIFIVAAVLTPPDVISQTFMAAPMLVLYELSVFVAALFGRKKELPEEEAKDEREDLAEEAADAAPASATEEPAAEKR
ncbi:twin-arginine translocase subunit TatC [Megalodesulfovibrio gigas]|uniref:Sec-independent protein translocase protein TatC n=2 Tax=Megalodesulfovibrio gigas TaxID=879 RepID=T2GCP5_MEGG1|nr:putative Sec-independent protein translocase subunit TatC [Megalodesulfovibrio gigas DSM 1382 = ATCC 19364]